MEIPCGMAVPNGNGSGMSHEWDKTEMAVPF
jgi:hypothetical protein